MMARHSNIHKVSVTGSIGTGQKVMADAASTLKYVTLELGGKSPLIVFEDCDLESAVHGALAANYYSQGQVCSNASRVFVHESLYEQFTELLLPKVRAIVVGDPMKDETQMGALISQKQLARVLDYVASGKKEGARVLAGGQNYTEGELAKGNFMAPTVLDSCRDDMKLVREEIFGPVMSLLPFRTEAEVIARANDTPMGLSAGLFTGSLSRAHRVSARLQAGNIWINNYNLTPIEIAFGGVKMSGIGRENGTEVLRHFVESRTIYVELGKLGNPFARS